MESAISHDIRISVNPSYKESYSNPQLSKFLFKYDVTIENLNAFSVQLLSRHWKIFDSIGFVKEVKGSGVIGKQPILQGNETYTYSSWCPIESELGFMEGNYTFKNILTNETFIARIPRFKLIAPGKLN